MELLQENSISCPYCGETISILVDASVEDQEYIEDCQVCCRPIVIRASIAADGRCRVRASDENEG